MSQRHTTKLPRRHQLVARTDTAATRERPRQAEQDATRATTRKDEQRSRSKRTITYEYSSSLFAEPSFLRGIARLFDLSGSLSSRLDGLTPDEIDALGLLADYQAVLEDHRVARRRMRQLGLWEDVVA